MGKHEKECLKSAGAGKFWTNPLTEKRFGKADDPGFLDAQGAPVWKQRAFEDYLQDLYASFFGVKLLRISVWDEFLYSSKLYKVKDCLNGDFPELKKALLQHLGRRIEVLLTKKPG